MHDIYIYIYIFIYTICGALPTRSVAICASVSAAAREACRTLLN